MSHTAPSIEKLAGRLTTLGLRMLSVESCTGGLVAARLTEVPGSSDWLEGAFVTYRLSAKTRMVGVAPALLATHGAVSEPVARAMAEGGLAASDADVAVAITGVAGPAGGDPVTPVGTVWFAWAERDGGEIRCVQTAQHRLAGARQAVRDQAVDVAIDGLLTLLG